MDARDKFNRLVGKGIGFISNVIEEAKKPSARLAKTGRAAPVEMVRVTDATGNEYFCPSGKLSNLNFVSEGEKGHCFDYSMVATHPE